jgi:uncharacterized protein YggT (Ycf19 family)
MEQTILEVAAFTFRAYYWLIFIYVLMSWVPPVRDSKFGSIISAIVEPYLSIFRKIIPPIGGIDLSPLLAIFLYNMLTKFALQGIQTFLFLISNYIA